MKAFFPLVRCSIQTPGTVASDRSAAALLWIEIAAACPVLNAFACWTTVIPSLKPWRLDADRANEVLF
jgi:hypothetical protein